MKHPSLILPIVFALASPAFGQTATPPPAAPAIQPTPAPQSTAKIEHRTEAAVEHRITELHGKLKITAAQEPVWTDFANTMRDNARHADQLYEARVPANQQTAVEAMTIYTQITRAHADDMDRLLPKFQALYAALSPEQRKVADETFAQYQKQMLRHGPHAG